MAKMDPVVHFEMPAKDKKRVSDFYSKVFGWKMTQLGPEMGDYLLAGTIESDDKGPTKPGGINGGFYKYEDKEGFNHPHVVLSVDNLEESIKKVKASGGQVLGGSNPNKKSPEEPDDIPGIGLYVSIKDTEGNIVGMLQPSPM